MMQRRLLSIRLLWLGAAVAAIAAGCAGGGFDSSGPELRSSRGSPTTALETAPPSTFDTWTPPPEDTGEGDEPRDVEAGDAPSDAGESDTDVADPDTSGSEADAPPTEDARPDIGTCGDTQCDRDEICRNQRCVDACQHESAVCGRLELEGRTFRCGTCSGPDSFCNAKHNCADVCKASGSQCGQVFWGGDSASCGSPCPSGETCLYNRCVDTGGYLDVAAGRTHTCAARQDGTVECWGGNGVEQLGSSASNPTPSPTEITGISSARAVASNYNHTCVLASSDVYCWGLNNHAQSGKDGPGRVGAPTRVQPLSRAVDVAAGQNHSCALLNTGGGRCWGRESSGQLGNGRERFNTTHASPVTVQGSATFEQLVAGGSHTCGVTAKGRIECWGAEKQIGRGFRPSKTNRPAAVQWPSMDPLRGVVVASAGDDHTCAVLQSGGVVCWGTGNNGELGDGDTGNHVYAVEVKGLDDARRVAASWTHTCAATTSGDVYCWGKNDRGQLGDGTTTSRTQPVEITDLPGSAVELAAGRDHTCALIESGNLYCWGGNEQGQLGTDSTSSSPVTTPKKVGP